MPPLVPPVPVDDTVQAAEVEPLVVQEDRENTNMGFDEQYVKPEGRAGDEPAKWAAVVSLGVFLVSTWAITIASDPILLGLFAFHPTLQSLSIAFFTYGILTLQPTNQPKTKAAGLVRHQLAMLVLGVPAIALGTGAIVLRKSLHNANHFVSWHGTMGIISVAWLLIQLVLGAGSVWFDGWLFGGNPGGRPKAKLIWKYHRLSGYILYPLFLATAYTGGAYSDWSTKHSPHFVRFLAFTISLAVLVAAVLFRVRTFKMKFF